MPPVTQKNTLGIENLKALLEFIILSFNATLDIDKNKDRKVSLTEVLSIVTTVGFKVPGLYDRLPDIKAEWKDLSDAEVQELAAWFTQTFDLPVGKDSLERLIKRTASMLAYNYQYYRDIRTILTPGV